VEELVTLQGRATRTRDQWIDIRSGRIRFATASEKLLHLEGTWLRWKQAVAELNAHRNNRARISSPRQGEVIRIPIKERTPPRSVLS
jgi:hypothetical protein